MYICNNQSFHVMLKWILQILTFLFVHSAAIRHLFLYPLPSFTVTLRAAAAALCVAVSLSPSLPFPPPCPPVIGCLIS